MPESDIDVLRQRLSALPQELYDGIYDLTFSPNLDEYTITAFWRPSHLLRVDYASRQRYLSHYFKPDATFTFRGLHHMNFEDRIVYWLQRRNPVNLATSQNMVVVLEGSIRDPARRLRLEHIGRARILMAMASVRAFGENHPGRKMVENMKFEFEAL